MASTGVVRETFKWRGNYRNPELNCTASLPFSWATVSSQEHPESNKTIYSPLKINFKKAKISLNDNVDEKNRSVAVTNNPIKHCY